MYRYATPLHSTVLRGCRVWSLGFLLVFLILALRTYRCTAQKLHVRADSQWCPICRRCMACDTMGATTYVPYWLLRLMANGGTFSQVVLLQSALPACTVRPCLWVRLTLYVFSISTSTAPSPPIAVASLHCHSHEVVPALKETFFHYNPYTMFLVININY